MNILFQSRSSLFSVPGGDTVQLIKTAEQLRSLGIVVDISTELEPDLSRYDLVHLFNLVRPQDVYLQARNAKCQGKAVALSTIYVDYSEYEKRARTGIPGLIFRHLPYWQIERLKVAARVVANGELSKGSIFTILFGYRRLCNRIIELSDILLPNSLSEMHRIHSAFPTSQDKPYVVVPNAVDLDVFDSDKVIVDKAVNEFNGCVLCVARIEGIKCQLELVRAMKDLPYLLVLVGKPAPNHMGYFDTVCREAGDRFRYIGQIPHEELAPYYKAAKVHCLVSWMETTGLSSLEAGAMGCNLVITDKGDTRDYFQDDAFYCEPDSVESVRDAIIRAYEAPRNIALQQRVRAEFNWGITAQRTLEGYNLALKRHTA